MGKSGKPRLRQPTLVGWVLPPTGKFKLNTDGSFDLSLKSGKMGGLIRDDKGQWVIGFHRRISHANSSCAVECWAIREGLKLAMDRNLKVIILETDSLTASQLINDSSNDNHELNNIICDCRFMLRWLESEVKHIFREGNHCADLLASLNFQQLSLVVFPNMPPSLGQALYDDASGKKFPRSCNSI